MKWTTHGAKRYQNHEKNGSFEVCIKSKRSNKSQQLTDMGLKRKGNKNKGKELPIPNPPSTHILRTSAIRATTI